MSRPAGSLLRSRLRIPRRHEHKHGVMGTGPEDTPSLSIRLSAFWEWCYQCLSCRHGDHSYHYNVWWSSYKCREHGATMAPCRFAQRPAKHAHRQQWRQWQVRFSDFYRYWWSGVCIWAGARTDQHRHRHRHTQLVPATHIERGHDSSHTLWLQWVCVHIGDRTHWWPLGYGFRLGYHQHCSAGSIHWH